MVELRRSIRCSNCGNENSFYLSVDMSISELLLHGKCSRCGNSLQINFTLIEPSSSTTPSSASSTGSTSSGGMVNVDESLFEPDIPNDVIKDLMEGA